jgi:multidrug efflux pump subunit AcrA (membrane-fusion protein)
VAALTPAPVVKVAEAVSRDVPIFVEAIGQTIGNTEIEISARVEGFLETMNFQQGSFVKKGRVLYTIDSRPFRTALAEAKAQLAQAKAELARSHQDVGTGAQDLADPGHSETEFQLLLADGSTFPHLGNLVFVDRNVDAKTGTIRLEASFPNPGGMLRPGQYARVRAAVDIKKGAVLVSQGSLQEVQGIHNVAFINAEGKVELRMVKRGERIGGLVIVDSGVKGGERIVVEGLQKVRVGIKVLPETVKLEEVAALSPATSEH